MSAGWQKSLSENLVPFAELAEKFDLDSYPLQAVIARYPFRLTRHYYNLIRQVNDPLWRQVVPDQRELLDEAQLPDPLNEAALSPVPGLIHRYPDRVVWLVSNECAVYCRFCMRKRTVGCGAGNCRQPRLADVLAYIRANPSIRDVILSGGDPLLLDDEELETILAALQQIPHVEMIRIGTRVPVTFPERITPALAALLKRYQPLYINTHFNHPREINPASAAACAVLADAGIPLGNQTVLLKGVNDAPPVMQALNRGLLQLRVKPYYLHHMDLVKGTSHFRTSVRSGLEIMDSLRGYLSGMAVPYYVIDLPEGKGKVPLLPGQEISDDGTIKLRTYSGETVEYQDIA
jgi:lysine 2,3-aminomutase